MRRFKVTAKSSGHSHHTYALDITRARQFHDERIWEVTESEPESHRPKYTGGDYSPSDLRGAIRRERFEQWIKQDCPMMNTARNTDGTYRDSGVGAMWISYKQGWEDSK